MWKARLQAFTMSFTDIFNTRDGEAKGRVINLTCTLLAAFYNVFITGIFYTGFLSMYDISITGAGIVTFIPYIANLFSIFSSKVLASKLIARVRHKKYVLLASKLFFYGMYILATTIMPQFVIDPDARLVWFIIILFIGYAVYAPFSPGITVWFYHFYPIENHRRTRYITLCQVFSSIMSSLVLLFSGFLTDAVEGSPYYETLIIGFRVFAFVLVMIECFVQSRAKEYNDRNDANLKLSQVFTLPFKYKKFLMCMILMFCWNYIANLNNGLWSYHLLNHMKFSYTLINTVSIMYTFILMFTSGLWSKVIRRYSWVKTFAIGLLLWWPSEIVAGVMTPETTYLYIPYSIVQNILSVCLNLSYANILYMNLPEENSTAHIAFHTIGCNICAFLGLISGTWLSSFNGDEAFNFLGLQIYSVQLTTFARAVLILSMGIILFTKWRSFTKDSDVEEIEAYEAARKKVRKMMPPISVRDVLHRLAWHLKNLKPRPKEKK